LKLRIRMKSQNNSKKKSPLLPLRMPTCGKTLKIGILAKIGISGDGKILLDFYTMRQELHDCKIMNPYLLYIKDLNLLL
jgi:hypothetical protein